MTALHLKIIALASMLMDHTAVVFAQQVPPWFRVVGRLAFPIFAYLVAEGFRHTRNPNKYLIRLAVFALLSQPFFGWALLGAATPWQVSFIRGTNIFYTLLLGGLAIGSFQRIKAYCTAQGDNELLVSAIACVPLLFYMWLGEWLGADFGAVGVAFVFTMYVLKHKKARLAAMAGLCLLLHRQLLRYLHFVYINPGQGTGMFYQPVPMVMYWMIPVTLLTVVLAAYYNGRRGPSMKWLFYAAYPGHLAILGGLHLLI